MSSVQAYLTGSGVAVAMSAIVAMVAPQPPIVVNSLTYENGFIIQDRDVTTGGLGGLNGRPKSSAPLMDQPYPDVMGAAIGHTRRGIYP